MRALLVCAVLALPGCILGWAFADGQTPREDVDEMVCREACARKAHFGGYASSTGWTESVACGCRFDDGTIVHGVPRVPNQ